MNNFFLSIEKVSVQLNGRQVLKDIDLLIGEKEQWAITGPGGSGKTVLIHTICGQHFFTGKISASFGTQENFQHRIAVVEQQHRFRDITNRSDFYYQQRYNSFDAERTLTVREDLDLFFSVEKKMKNGFSKTELIQLLRIDELLDEPLIQLSNGENKRLQLVKALLMEGELLILDQPFIGLDISGRQILHKVLNELSAKGIRLMLVGSGPEIPEYITHVAELNEGLLKSSGLKKDFKFHNIDDKPLPFIDAGQLKYIHRGLSDEFDFAVRMVDVNIKYGDKYVLRHIDWKVRKAEKWSLSGPNGAGKSTLLSLITADNPQAYANEIYLFDRKRGTGESIWDIKRRIGYISPELHLYFDSGATAFQTVASGLFDTIGLFRQLNQEQYDLVKYWMQLIQLLSVQDKLLSQLSLGEQRIILLARALIKNPPLLILDEPCQGLDEVNTLFFKAMIDHFCQTFHTTLIYVSHYHQEIPECVNLFLYLENGMIAQKTERQNSRI